MQLFTFKLSNTFFFQISCCFLIIHAQLYATVWRHSCVFVIDVQWIYCGGAKDELRCPKGVPMIYYGVAMNYHGLLTGSYGRIVVLTLICYGVNVEIV